MIIAVRTAVILAFASLVAVPLSAQKSPKADQGAALFTAIGLAAVACSGVDVVA